MSHDRNAGPGFVDRVPTIRIVGTGPVSLVLRGLLLRQGFSAGELVCDAPPAALPATLAQRALALSLGSWQALARVARPPESAAIRSVEVSLRASAGRTRLHADDLGVPVLGHVVRYAVLHQVLSESAAGSGSLTQLHGASAPAITVIADGNPGEASRLRDFDQAALLATVRVQKPAEGVAFERFTREGPLALLPLQEPGHWSLVWCAPPSLAQQRSQLSANDFARELQRNFGPWLGRLELLDRPQLAPLQRRFRTELVRDDEVTIGNAAQSLHPVAGQGLNLGIRDAFVLASALGDARARGDSLRQALQTFSRMRRNDRLATIAATDTLASVFTRPFLAPAQSLALGLLDLVPPARRRFARAFMFGLRG
jgi:2-octaprenyl-6-methoxyphenol hydroxylase